MKNIKDTFKQKEVTTLHALYENITSQSIFTYAHLYSTKYTQTLEKTSQVLQKMIFTPDNVNWKKIHTWNIYTKTFIYHQPNYVHLTFKFERYSREKQSVHSPV